MAKPNLEVYIGADIDGFNKGLKEVEKKSAQFGKNLDQNTKQTDNFGSAMNKVGGVIAGAFALDAIIGFGKAVIDITAEFQKFEAVLTNTLGSKSAARAAMAQIQKFAAETPFSVQELTSSFVKLANQGFKPTADEMRKLGDLAASTGKTFDMLTEAIIDAQTGEFERLKEFGIRAQKQGDQLTFAFKGVQTQTEFTSEAIREYVLSLGDAVGVSGSMAAVSKTLGGQISNLGDTWDKFLVGIGSKTEGAVSKSIKAISSLIEMTADLMAELNLEDVNYTNQAEIVKRYKEIEDGLTGVQKALPAYALNQEKVNLAIYQGTVFTKAWNQAVAEVTGETQKASDEIESYRQAALTTFMDEKAAIEARNKALEDANKLRRNNIRQQNITASDNFSTGMIGAEYADKDIQKSAAFSDGEMPDIGIDYEAAGAGADAYYNKIAEGELKSAMAMENTGEAMQSNIDIANLLGNELSSMFDDLFSDLMKGELTWKKFGQTVLATIGRIISKLIAQAIISAIAAEAPKGIVGVATGAIAAAGFTSMLNGVQKFADGGIVSGETLGIMGEYQGAKSNPEVIAPLSKLTSLMKGMGGSNVMVNGEFRVNGRDLVVVLQNENRFTNRTN